MFVVVSLRVLLPLPFKCLLSLGVDFLISQVLPLAAVDQQVENIPPTLASVSKFFIYQSKQVTLLSFFKIDS